MSKVSSRNISPAHSLSRSTGELPADGGHPAEGGAGAAAGGVEDRHGATPRGADPRSPRPLGGEESAAEKFPGRGIRRRYSEPTAAAGAAGTAPGSSIALVMQSPAVHRVGGCSALLPAAKNDMQHNANKC